MISNFLSRTGGIDWTWDKETGKVTGCPYAYSTYGSCVSEVEVDCLTGEHIILRTDIVMDLGKSLNPSIDVGQVCIITNTEFKA